MDEANFKNAVSNILNDEYDDTDIKTVHCWLNSLCQKEASLIKEIESTRSTFVKKKNKLTSDLTSIKRDIKGVHKILSKIKKQPD